MKAKKITLRHLKMPLKAPFATSFGEMKEKSFLLVEVEGEDGTIGYGETTSMEAPAYNEETVETNRHILKDFLVPIVFSREWQHPDELTEAFAPIRRNMMAKAAIEGAMWDLYAKQQGITLASALGGTKQEIEVGVSIGIQPSLDHLYQVVEGFLDEGYRRMKIKIKPGYDVKVIAGLRQRFGPIPMMADANSAYTLADTSLLKELDAFDLMMIEQPLAHDDIIDHAALQRELKTPICLDESIHTVDDARKAIELGSCRIINIKIGRVGGLTPAKQIHDLCNQKGIAVWCGGMLESGVGRAHNIAITTLNQFILPGDTSGSNRYWVEDLIEPEVTVRQGLIHVPKNPGIGYQVAGERVSKYTVGVEFFTP